MTEKYKRIYKTCRALSILLTLIPLLVYTIFVALSLSIEII